MSIKTEMKITNPKLAFNSSVNFVVCVMNPGPIADVAMRNAAPNKGPERKDLFCMHEVVNGFCKFNGMLTIAMNANSIGLY